MPKSWVGESTTSVMLMYMQHNLTLASHSSILWVAISAGDSGAAWTVSESTLTTTASNTVQVDWTNTSTKMSTAEWNCTCWSCTIVFIQLLIKHAIATDFEWSIPALDTPQQRQHFPRSHHTQCPTHCSCRSPLFLHLLCYLLPVAADQLYKELCYENRLFMQ